MSVSIPVPWGELIDKITILEIKKEELANPEALANVTREHDALSAVQNAHAPLPAELAGVKQALLEVNRQLWKIEDDIRDCERQGDFGQTFIELARSVYITNDRRAALKRQVNELMNSDLFEEKSYTDYQNG